MVRLRCSGSVMAIDHFMHFAFGSIVPTFAGMWTTMDSSGNFGYETFSLRLHPLQDQVPPQQLLRVWTHRLMDAVSEVGGFRCLLILSGCLPVPFAVFSSESEFVVFVHQDMLGLLACIRKKISN